MQRFAPPVSVNGTYQDSLLYEVMCVAGSPELQRCSSISMFAWHYASMLAHIMPVCLLGGVALI